MDISITTEEVKAATRQRLDFTRDLEQHRILLSTMYGLIRSSKGVLDIILTFQRKRPRMMQVHGSLLLEFQ